LSKGVGVKHVPGESGRQKQRDENWRSGIKVLSVREKNPGRGILEKSDEMGFSNSE
jgi:hypothetical protein